MTVSRGNKSFDGFCFRKAKVGGLARSDHILKE